jgi:hypothetical protein
MFDALDNELPFSDIIKIVGGRDRALLPWFRRYTFQVLYESDDSVTNDQLGMTRMNIPCDGGARFDLEMTLIVKGSDAPDCSLTVGPSLLTERSAAYLMGHYFQVIEGRYGVKKYGS